MKKRLMALTGLIIISSLILFVYSTNISDPIQATCLKYTPATDELSAVDFYIDGSWSMEKGMKYWNGSCYLTDEEGKTCGGLLEHIPIIQMTDHYYSLSLFYYDTIGERYESLGALFLKLDGRELLLVSEGDYICYPADSVKDIEKILATFGMTLN